MPSFIHKCFGDTWKFIISYKEANEALLLPCRTNIDVQDHIIIFLSRSKPPFSLQVLKV